METNSNFLINPKNTNLTKVPLQCIKYTYVMYTCFCTVQYCGTDSEARLKTRNFRVSRCTKYLLVVQLHMQCERCVCLFLMLHCNKKLVSVEMFNIFCPMGAMFHMSNTVLITFTVHLLWLYTVYVI